MPARNIPSINGLSISSLKMMEGLDGYVIRCNLNLNGKKIAEYFDGGHGGEYNLTPEKGWTRESVEALVHDFPKFPSDFKNLPDISWDAGILVEELITRQDIYKMFQKNKKKGLVTVAVSDASIAFTIGVSPETRENSIYAFLKKEYGEQRTAGFKIRRYDADKDFIEEYNQRN